MSNDSTTAIPKVGVLTRVIATGVEYRKGKERVGRATLSLMPWVGEKANFAGAVSLENWPAEIEKKLTGARLFVSQIANNVTTKLEPDCNELGNGICLRRSAAKPPDRRANDLWKTLIAECDDSVWASLATVLSQGQTGATLNALCSPSTDANVAPTPGALGAGGSKDIKQGNAVRVPDVYAYPRADAALLYGFQRAREVLRTMRGQSGECRIGDCVIKTGGRFLDLSHFSFNRKPWLGIDGPLVRLAQATMSDAQSPDLERFAKRDQLLAQERTINEQLYRRQLADKKQKATEQATQRTDYLRGKDVDTRVAALKKHAAARATSIPPTDCADACGATTEDSIANQLTDQVKSAHSFGSLPDVDELGNAILTPNDVADVFDVSNEQAKQRFYAITAMPSLARLFNLVIDVEFNLDEFESELQWDPSHVFKERNVADHDGDLSGKLTLDKMDGNAADATYMFLTTNLGRADDPGGDCSLPGESNPPRVWTLAKFRKPQNTPMMETGHFWPCSREEIDVRLKLQSDKKEDTTGTALRDSCAVFQFDGVVDLGVSYCEDGGIQNPRYDIVSLDTIQTVESDIQSERRLQQLVTTAKGNPQATGNLGVPTRRTGGLAVLDRWRQDQAVSQISTTNFQIGRNNDIVLDAEDMTTAYRLDVGIVVGVGNGVPTMVWRSLMNRKMTFGAPNNGTGWLDQAVAELYEWRAAGEKENTERRRRADGASLSVASRLRQNGTGGGSAMTVFAEQIMIAWHGDPLGVDCVDPQESSGVKVESQGLSIPASGLPLDLSYGLESDEDDYRPPPLRYGWPYHLGLRPVYLGGVILPIEQAIARYALNFKNGSALPSPLYQSGRRFLRHERIEAPLLTVPRGIASKIKPDSRQDDPAAVDTGATCLLRTSTSQIRKDAYPSSTVRILFPPIMQLDQVVLHGRFDKDNSEVRPRDGLHLLDFSGDPGEGSAAGGFPHYVTGKVAAGSKPKGPAVFQLTAKAKPRKIPFYPDPAATHYVIAARRPQTDDYLDGTIVISATSPEVSYPDVLPLAIEVKKTGKRSSPARTIHDLFQGDFSTVAYADQAGTLSGKRGGVLPVRHAVAALALGEDFEIEIWCGSSKDEILNTFDIVESVAVLLMRDSATEHLADGQLDQACLDSLNRYFPELQFEVQKLLQTRNWQGKKPNPLCGSGGISLPQTAVMEHVAATISAVLSRRPMPELAATTVLHAIHAIDKPLVCPRFAEQDAPPAGLRIARLNDATFAAVMRADQSGASPKAVRLRNDHASWDGLSDDGATNAIFDGEIVVDLLACRDVELRAMMVSPASPAFDDVNRGRTAEEKARGAYRPIGTPAVTASTQWPGLDAAKLQRDSGYLFGFAVNADGRVTLPRSVAPLVRFHDLPDMPTAQRVSDVKSVRLLCEQQAAYRASPPQTPSSGVTSASTSVDAKSSSAGPRVQYIQPFRDGLARRLDLELVSTSRFSNLFPPSRDNAGALEAKSQPVSVWLPATKRPDPPSAKSLRPSFVWSSDAEPKLLEPVVGLASPTSVTTAVRYCSIHLPFERPHFTSGEGERVGIVIWPPDLMLQAKTNEIDKDLVRRSEQEKQPIRLDDAFSDSDLGPGGEYVTRWGADPIREGPRPKGWLIPAKAFLDYTKPLDSEIKFERNVLMPIPRKPDAGVGKSSTSPQAESATSNSGSQNYAGGSSDPQASDAAGREFMLVSLLTYEPRFDIDYERWYVNIRMDAGNVPEPFIRFGLVRFQEHARPELQVSEPIVEWVQVMSKRAVCVSAEALDSNRVELTVEVSTPAVYQGSAPLFRADSDKVDAPGGAPFMKACVIRNETTSGGGTIQTIVTPEGFANAIFTQLLPKQTADGTTWSGSISLVCAASESGGDASYSVYVEEIESFLPTANPIDAETDAPIAHVVETGPRFAAILPISLPAFAPKPPVTPAQRKPVAVHPKPRTYAPALTQEEHR